MPTSPVGFGRSNSCSPLRRDVPPPPPDVEDHEQTQCSLFGSGLFSLFGSCSNVKNSPSPYITSSYSERVEAFLGEDKNYPQVVAMVHEQAIRLLRLIVDSEPPEQFLLRYNSTEFQDLRQMLGYAGRDFKVNYGFIGASEITRILKARCEHFLGVNEKNINILGTGDEMWLLPLDRIAKERSKKVIIESRDFLFNGSGTYSNIVFQKCSLTSKMSFFNIDLNTDNSSIKLNKKGTYKINGSNNVVHASDPDVYLSINGENSEAHTTKFAKAQIYKGTGIANNNGIVIGNGINSQLKAFGGGSLALGRNYCDIECVNGGTGIAIESGTIRVLGDKDIGGEHPVNISADLKRKLTSVEECPIEIKLFLEKHYQLLGQKDSSIGFACGQDSKVLIEVANGTGVAISGAEVRGGGTMYVGDGSTGFPDQSCSFAAVVERGGWLNLDYVGDRENENLAISIVFGGRVQYNGKVRVIDDGFDGSIAELLEKHFPPEYSIMPKFKKGLFLGGNNDSDHTRDLTDSFSSLLDRFSDGVIESFVGVVAGGLIKKGMNVVAEPQVQTPPQTPTSNISGVFKKFFQ